MTTRLDEEPTAEARIREVLDAQPDDVSYDEVLRAPAFGRMVERGLEDVRAGRTSSHADALRRIRAWRA